MLQRTLNETNYPFNAFIRRKLVRPFTNNCTTCPFIENGRTQYAFNSTGQIYKIKWHSTCETSNVIYMIQCTKCNLQYIGETKRRLKHPL